MMRGDGPNVGRNVPKKERVGDIDETVLSLLALTRTHNSCIANIANTIIIL